MNFDVNAIDEKYHQRKLKAVSRRTVIYIGRERTVYNNLISEY